MRNILAILLLVAVALPIAGASANASASVNYTFVSNSLANAVLTGTMHAFLATYANNSVIANGTLTNVTYGGMSYAMLQANPGKDSYFFINTSNKDNYSFVFNQSLAFTLLRPYMLGKYYPGVQVVNSLVAQMQAYIKAGQGTLNDCLTVTGLDNRLCTASQSLISCLQQSCQSVPICQQGIQSFPPPSPFTTGIQNFSEQYIVLNDSEHQYLSLANALNQDNIGTSITSMASLAATIGSEARQIPLNPIFPPPTNMTAQQEGQICNNYLSGGGPWYCYDVGLCRYTTFNAIILTSLQSQLGYLGTLPLSNSSVDAVAYNATQNAYALYNPVVYAKDTVKFDAFLNAAVPSYNSLYANMSFVSARFSNALLAGALANLSLTYNNIIQAGPTQNVIAANAMLSSAVANAMKVYTRVAVPYMTAYGEATNNTAKLLARQLDYRPGAIPFQIASLASQETAINILLSSTVNASQLNAILARLSAITPQVNGLSPPPTFESAINSFDGPIVDAIVYGQSGSLASRIASVPIYTSLISFLVGLAVLAIVYMGTYHRLKAHGKIKMKPSVHRAWKILFVIFFVIVLAYTFLTYTYTASANSFVPLSSFMATVHSSNSIYFLVNKSISTNQSTRLCISALKATLVSEHKSVYIQNVTGSLCAAPYNTNVSAGICFERIIASETPAVIFNQTGNSTIIFKGIYGDTLYVGGPAAQGSGCILNTVFKVS